MSQKKRREKSSQRVHQIRAGGGGGIHPPEPSQAQRFSSGISASTITTARQTYSNNIKWIFVHKIFKNSRIFKSGGENLEQVEQKLLVFCKFLL